MQSNNHSESRSKKGDARPRPVVVRVKRHADSVSTEPTIQSQMAEERTRLLEELSQHIIEVHRLVTRVTSDEFSPSERERLRRLASYDGVPRVFELSNSLYQCCGEEFGILQPDGQNQLRPSPLRTSCLRKVGRIVLTLLAIVKPACLKLKKPLKEHNVAVDGRVADISLRQKARFLNPPAASANSGSSNHPLGDA